MRNLYVFLFPLFTATANKQETKLHKEFVTHTFSQVPANKPVTVRPKMSKTIQRVRTTQSAGTRTTINQTNYTTKPNKQLHLLLRSKEIMECFSQTKLTHSDIFRTQVTQFYKKLSALEGSFEWQHNFNEWRHPRGCGLQIIVPEGFHAVVQLKEIPFPSKIRVSDEESRVMLNCFLTHGHCRTNRMFFSKFNEVVIILKVSQEFLVGRFILRFHSAEKSFIEVRHTSSNKGLVRTHMYNEEVFIWGTMLNQWGHVTIPANHVVMVSWPTFHTLAKCVELYAENTGRGRLAVTCPEDFVRPLATVYDTKSLHIHLCTGMQSNRPSNAKSTGFEIYFSFHNESALPTKLPDHTWNCSVPYKADFLHHLACNLDLECQDAEDESNCLYTSPLCGPGYLTVGGACIFHLRERITSWTEASDACALRGERLAILSREDKWVDLLRWLPNREVYPVKVFIGITHVLYTLPIWYDVRNGKPADMLHFSDCPKRHLAKILCEKEIPTERLPGNIVTVNGSSRWPRDEATFIVCPSGHYTHQFLACDVSSACWYRDPSSGCDWPQTPLPPSFTCTNQREHVPYTLVCDYRADCNDGSDEDFCSVPQCRFGQFSCGNKQCILATKECDGWRDCRNEEDEHTCGLKEHLLPTMAPPALVSLSDRGFLVVQRREIAACPHTHFQCPDNGYCLPVLLRCNRVYDCPGREDETDCDSCPGFFRCRSSSVCLPSSHLCDGHAHCPQHDDELVCRSTCPPYCVCRGLSFFCKHSFEASAYPLVRFLDASGSSMTPDHLVGNHLLIHLSLANCSLKCIDGLLLQNLLSLHLQDNQLNNITRAHLDGVPQLRELSVAGNPLQSVFESVDEYGAFVSLNKLDMSCVVMHVFKADKLSAFPNLRVLNLSHSGVQRVEEEGFRSLEQLRVVDLRGCPMTWLPGGMFRGLSHLQAVYAHNFKMCCPAMLPLDFNLHSCFAHSDGISSCDDLLREQVCKISVFVLSLFALAGNAASFIFRTFVSKREIKLGYGNFVTHLSLSDFLMGVYLAIIGGADQIYQGKYLWNDVAWRHSPSCKLAGFLSLLSSEVSALIVCLITLDRFLVLCFPFSRLHFSPTSAQMASAVVWMSGVLVASVPLLPIASQWEFYSQTGICSPLPITSAVRSYFEGQKYSFSVFVVFNFILFVFICMGQLIIYWSVRTNSMSVSNTTKKTKDQTIARRLITVAMTDFMCWFPIGLLGLLASNGFPIHGEVNVAVAIFVLPLNSAVNPCLYTVNIMLERRRRVREERLRAFLLAKVKAQNG